MAAGTDPQQALRQAAEINAQVANGMNSIFGFERIAMRQGGQL
jgi:hypothetical protein